MLRHRYTLHHTATTLHHTAIAVCIGLLLALAPLSGCGEGDQEHAFREATEGLESAQAEVEEARARVEEKRTASEAAERELADALQLLEEARADLAEAREKVGRHATDAVLFRTVQGRLLDESALEEVAIAARVEKGVVELSGSVPHADLRKLAEKIAAGTPGVVAVENRIQVSASAPAGT